MSENTKKTNTTINENENTENKDIINPEEFAVAKKEAKESKSVYVHKFAKPFTYAEKTYEELTFEWDKLTGADSLAIEGEIAALGKVVITPEFSGEYLIRLAAKACTEKIGSDVLSAMSLRDYNKIRGKARSFLMGLAL